MKKLLFLLILIMLNNILLSQEKKSPNIYKEIYNENYDFNDFGATFNTINILFNVNLPPYHLGSFGVLDLQTGEKIINRNLKDTIIPGLGELSIAQAFNYYHDKSYSLFSIASDLNGYFVFDDSLNLLLNFHDLNIFPDVHGIEKLSDGRYAFFEVAEDTSLIFYSSTFPDSTEWDVASYNVKIFDPSDSSVTLLFDWFQTVPTSMFLPEYLYSGDFDGAIEWGHPNSIFQDYDDNLLISWLSLGVCKIDIQTGDVIWWAGLPDSLAQNNGFDQLFCDEGDCRFRLQHDLKPIPNLPNHYTLHDNGDSIRPECRAIFFTVNEDSLKMDIYKEHTYPLAELMGSVDVAEDGRYIVNTIDINAIPRDRIPSWFLSGHLIDSVGFYAKHLGSRMYFYDVEDNLVAKYWTDSANLIYNSFLINLTEWPSLYCNHDTVLSSIYPENLTWENIEDTLSLDSFIIATGDTLFVSFPFGITTGKSKLFNSADCIETQINHLNTNMIRVFPNPFSEYIFIDIDFISLKIYDTMGKSVYSGIDKTINTTSLASGIYFLHIETKDGDLNIKLMKN